VSKYYYERSSILESKINITYHELFCKSDEELDDWIEEVRQYIIEEWDERGVPPMVGQSIADITNGFRKLREYDIHGFIEKDDDGNKNVIKNFNKFANGVNQFFPTMLKTRIGDVGDVGLNSIYDRIKEDVNKDLFYKAMRRGVRRDSMYSFSKSLSLNRKENEQGKKIYWGGESATDWLQYYKDNPLKFSKFRIWIAKSHQSKYFKQYVTITADEIRQAYKDGLITDGMLTNVWCPTLKKKLSVDDVTDTVRTKGGNVKTNVFMIRYYHIEKKLFPSAFQIFRLSLNSQPAVNFPPLTARLLYEKMTNHIEQDEPLNIYDPSAGWGGRILGAMASKKRIHYIGTDPNTDNYIDEIGKSRYEYVADFFNEHGLETNPFWEEKKNTYHVFQEGSEHIGNHPDFQQYKGKLDMVFTSPPYFDREQYSEDEAQSFKSYPMYSDWRDNFLKPTLTNAYESLKSDRYLLWNIADIKIGKTTFHPLEQDSIDIIESLGGEYKGKLKMLMASMIGVDQSNVKNCVSVDEVLSKYEPIFIFHKG
jgi:hypothetical protein